MNKRISRTEKNKVLIILLVSLFILSCSKEVEPISPIANSGNFKLNGKKYSAEYAAYEIGDNSYSLYFYSEGISFLSYPAGLIGYGNIIQLSINESIFNSADFAFNNLRVNESISISGGNAYIDYSTSNNTGLCYEIDYGTIVSHIKNDFYFFEYNIVLKNGEEVSGSCAGNLIVYKRK